MFSNFFKLGGEPKTGKTQDDPTQNPTGG